MLTVLCVVYTSFLYIHNHFSASSIGYPTALPNPSEAIIIDSQPKMPQNALSSNFASILAAFIPNNANPAKNVSEENRSGFLKMIMIFSDYLGHKGDTPPKSCRSRKTPRLPKLRTETGDRRGTRGGPLGKVHLEQSFAYIGLIHKVLKRPREERAKWLVQAFPYVSLIGSFSFDRFSQHLASENKIS